MIISTSHCCVCVTLKGQEVIRDLQRRPGFVCRLRQGKCRTHSRNRRFNRRADITKSDTSSYRHSWNKTTYRTRPSAGEPDRQRHLVRDIKQWRADGGLDAKATRLASGNIHSLGWNEDITYVTQSGNRQSTFSVSKWCYCWRHRTERDFILSIKDTWAQTDTLTGFHYFTTRWQTRF